MAAAVRLGVPAGWNLQVEKQLKAGNLKPEQHKVLVGQLDQLYELQRKKEAEKRQCDQSSTPPSSPPKSSKEELSSSQRQIQTDSQTSSQSLHAPHPPPPPHSSTVVHRNKPHPFIKSERHVPAPPPPSHPPRRPPVHDRFPSRPRFRGRGPRPRRGWSDRAPGPYRHPLREPFPPPALPHMDFPPGPPPRPPHWQPLERGECAVLYSCECCVLYVYTILRHFSSCLWSCSRGVVQFFDVIQISLSSIRCANGVVGCG